MRNIAADAFSVQSLNVTERMMLKDVSYGLLKISRHPSLDDHVKEMEKRVESG